MKYDQIDQLLRIFSKKNPYKSESEGLREVLSNEALKDYINSHFYIQWNKTLPNKGSKQGVSFSDILKGSGLTEEDVSYDKILFNHRTGKKHRHRRIAFEFLKYAAVGLLSFFSAYGILTRKSEQLIGSIDSMTEYNVPVGSKSSLVLSDGTKVWLNSGSKIVFPERFSSDKRVVNLVGEAYFEVKKSDDVEFVVSTEKIDIEVLGTKFNVKCYPEEENIEATLLEGSIKIIENADVEKSSREYLLTPNQSAVYNKSSTDIAIKNLLFDEQNVEEDEKENEAQQVVNKTFSRVETVVSWKDQTLTFEQERLEDIAIKLERWYGQKLVFIDEELKDGIYTGKFRNNESIYQVLEALSVTTPIEVTSVNNEIFIRKKK